MSRDDAKRFGQRQKLRVRRLVHRQKKQVEDAAASADDSIDRLVFRRAENLYRVRRFVASWVVLTLFIGFGSVWQVRGLDTHYLELVPTTGGVYREGTIGAFTNTNPLFAVTNVDVSVSRLVFSGLFMIGPDGELTPDLATDIASDERGVQYTVSLRDDVLWHDGEPFTAEDVVFTYETIKNPDVNSPLSPSWRDVSIAAPDDFTVVFTIPDTLSSFIYSLTNGIVPEHRLADVDAGDMRTYTFNTVDPIGTGPFVYDQVEVIGSDLENRQEKVTLEAYDDYHRGDVSIDGVVMRTYRDERSMIEAFEQQQITAMVGLNSVPDSLPDDDTIRSYSVPLRSAVMAFFNTSTDLLSDPNVRQALISATNTDGLRQRVNYPLIKVDSPFLKSHFSYDEERVQLPPSIDETNRLLDEAGWLLGNDGYRYKDGNRLTISIVSQSLAEYSTIITGLQEQWLSAGINLEATLQPEADVQSGVIVSHDYEILLYGIAIGPDPDVFAFWHSSQADPRLRTRLNLSEYSSETADLSLEAGRTRIDENLRSVKYQDFLDSWRDDVPAIALYQPRFLLVTRGNIDGYPEGQFNNPSDRFYTVDQWRIRREKAVQ